ncbi:hypothetical protein IVB45_20770 [Bradyrhizobium sp. 4]|uniref:hypothetical protein n=1 Tax=unclassified Bradyrhizobium TaxID=2631580 RepID=UPI001FFA4BA7|nr:MULTISPECIES: hypothetical protein [unclassified Bradyrhizobium]MCK1402335.1 hypothetical protein [Bradyrhizobium sp. 39]MCK1747930.1 hypothetical protein [Bradyrhizobium sp. 135]UPJ32424.1 hypothetical protein IVB45_20770 [Bradyrhizobium sp. 4]
MTDDRNPKFEAFLSDWTSKNLGSLGDQTDPSDHKYLAGVRADRLKEDAEAAGFPVEVRRLSLSFKGGLREFILGAYERAEFRRKLGDNV